MNKLKLFTLSAAALLLNGPILAQAEDNADSIATQDVPMSFSHHGLIYEGGKLASGTHSLRARLYNQDDEVLSEETVELEVVEGYYSITLTIDGSNKAKLLAATKLALGLKIDDKTEMSPRLAINSVPYSIKAAHAGTADNINCEGCITTSSLSDGTIIQNIINKTDANGDINFIANNTVTADSLADGSVTTAKIANSAVTAVKIADGAISDAKLASNSVITAKIKDANVTTAKIANSAVTAAKIADGAISDAKLASNSVITAKIKDANVTTAKIADANITTTKIKDGAVTNAKIGSDVYTAKAYGTFQFTRNTKDNVNNLNNNMIGKNYSVTSPSTGVYKITFENALANENYVVFAAINNDGSYYQKHSVPLSYSVSDKSVNGFVLTTYAISVSDSSYSYTASCFGYNGSQYSELCRGVSFVVF